MPDVTEAVQLKVPPPVFFTLSDDVPAALVAEIEVGVTDSVGTLVPP